jgi:molybdate transport system substrate-binding protein
MPPHNRPGAWLALSLVVLAALATGCGSGPADAGKRTVRVAAAADLKFAFDDLAAEFRAAHPDIDLQITFGSSGTFFAQLSNRAPFDVFFSADRDYPRQLIEQGSAVKESEFVYAIGHVVVWVPQASPLDVERRGAEALTDPAAKKIAIANPKFAPYGRAAEAALKKLKVYDRIHDRLVLGDNIAQTAQFVESGAADAGVLSLSLALAPALRDKGRFWRVPDDAHPPLEQAAVVLSWAKDRAAAQALCDFVRGDRGKAVLRRYGFAVPGD